MTIYEIATKTALAVNSFDDVKGYDGYVEYVFSKNELEWFVNELLIQMSKKAEAI